MYDVTLSYSPVKYLASTTQGKRNCMAIGPDSAVLATIAHTGPQDEVGHAASYGIIVITSLPAGPCAVVQLTFVSRQTVCPHPLTPTRCLQPALRHK